MGQLRHHGEYNCTDRVPQPLCIVESLDAARATIIDRVRNSLALMGGLATEGSRSRCSRHACQQAKRSSCNPNEQCP
jgi:hypothetical protein